MTVIPTAQGYPVILGGDHAAFELEHAGMDPKARPDWPLPSFDARDWAEAFCKIANGFEFKSADGKPIDPDWMVTWFANALMRGYDEQTARLMPVIAELTDALKAMTLNMRNDGGEYRDCYKVALAVIAKAEDI